MRWPRRGSSDIDRMRVASSARAYLSTTVSLDTSYLRRSESIRYPIPMISHHRSMIASDDRRQNASKFDNSGSFRSMRNENEPRTNADHACGRPDVGRAIDRIDTGHRSSLEVVVRTTETLARATLIAPKNEKKNRRIFLANPKPEATRVFSAQEDIRCPLGPKRLNS